MSDTAAVADTVRVLVVAPLGDTDALLVAPAGAAVPCVHIRSEPGTPPTHSAWFGTVPEKTAADLVATALLHPDHQTMSGVAVAVWADPETDAITLTAGFSLNTVGRPWDDVEALAGLGLRRVASAGGESGPTAFDAAIESDIAAGRLEAAGRKADADFDAGRVTPLEPTAVAPTSSPVAEVEPAPVSAPVAAATPQKPSLQSLLKKK